ncbi:MAG: hypothetical protein WC683_04125 [bacterium]
MEKGRTAEDVRKAEALLKKHGIASIERRYKGDDDWEKITVEEFIRRTEWANYYKPGTAAEALVADGAIMTPWAFFCAMRADGLKWLPSGKGGAS